MESKYKRIVRRAGNPQCPGGMAAVQAWNRDAIRAERGGFDCAKGHPAMGNYHHHQNPSAFNLDLEVISNICDLYLADGLYTIDSTEHSPLIGFAYDGFPIYGAYGFKNVDGSGGITRIKSGYSLRNITVRTQHADGTDVADGPPVNTPYPLGYFREDYEFITSASPDILDVHNGRFCITPEYPQGIYCYFATVDSDWNSAYPYVVGPTFYGTRTASKVQTIGEPTTVYNPTIATYEIKENLNLNVFPNPTSDFVAVQVEGLIRDKIAACLFDISGKLLQETDIQPGSTIGYLDCRTLYDGVYLVSFEKNGQILGCERVVVKKE